MNLEKIKEPFLLILFLVSKVFVFFSFIEILFITYVLLKINDINVYLIDSNNILYFYITLVIFNILYIMSYFSQIRYINKKHFLKNHIQVFLLNILFLSYIIINGTFSLYIFIIYFIFKNIKITNLKYEKKELFKHIEIFLLLILFELLLGITLYLILDLNLMMIILSIVNILFLIYHSFSSYNLFVYFYDDLFHENQNKSLLAEMTYKRDILVFFQILSFSILLYLFSNNIDIFLYILALKFIFYFNYSRNSTLLDTNIFNHSEIYQNNLIKSPYL